MKEDEYCMEQLQRQSQANGTDRRLENIKNIVRSLSLK